MGGCASSPPTEDGSACRHLASNTQLSHLGKQHSGTVLAPAQQQQSVRPQEIFIAQAQETAILQLVAGELPQMLTLLLPQTGEVLYSNRMAVEYGIKSSPDLLLALLVFEQHEVDKKAGAGNSSDSLLHEVLSAVDQCGSWSRVIKVPCGLAFLSSTQQVSSRAQDALLGQNGSTGHSSRAFASIKDTDSVAAPLTQHTDVGQLLEIPDNLLDPSVQASPNNRGVSRFATSLQDAKIELIRPTSGMHPSFGTPALSRTFIWDVQAGSSDGQEKAWRLDAAASYSLLRDPDDIRSAEAPGSLPTLFGSNNGSTSAVSGITKSGIGARKEASRALSLLQDVAGRKSVTLQGLHQQAVAAGISDPPVSSCLERVNSAGHTQNPRLGAEVMLTTRFNSVSGGRPSAKEISIPASERQQPGRNGEWGTPGGMAGQGQGAVVQQAGMLRSSPGLTWQPNSKNCTEIDELLQTMDIEGPQPHPLAAGRLLSSQLSFDSPRGGRCSHSAHRSIARTGSDIRVDSNDGSISVSHGQQSGDSFSDVKPPDLQSPIMPHAKGQQMLPGGLQTLPILPLRAVGASEHIQADARSSGGTVGYDSTFTSTSNYVRSAGVGGTVGMTSSRLSRMQLPGTGPLSSTDKGQLLSWRSKQADAALMQVTPSASVSFTPPCEGSRPPVQLDQAAIALQLRVSGGQSVTDTAPASLAGNSPISAQGPSWPEHQAMLLAGGWVLHEVFAKRVRGNVCGGRPALLLTQRDVTTSAQLEVELAEITESTLNMMSYMFPRHCMLAFERLGDKGLAPSLLADLSREHASVTVLFMDLVSFTSLSLRCSANEVICFVNELFSAFAQLVHKHGAHVIDTAGDSLIVCAGALMPDGEGFNVVPEETPNPVLSARTIYALAQDMLRVSCKLRLPNSNDAPQIRIGVHSGPCVSGCVGTQIPKWTILGSTVNLAARLEQNAPADHLHVTAATRDLLLPGVGADLVPTGGVHCKGVGMVESYVWGLPLEWRNEAQLPPDFFSTIVDDEPPPRNSASKQMAAFLLQQNLDSQLSLSQLWQPNALGGSVFTERNYNVWMGEGGLAGIPESSADASPRGSAIFNGLAGVSREVLGGASIEPRGGVSREVLGGASIEPRGGGHLQVSHSPRASSAVKLVALVMAVSGQRGTRRHSSGAPAALGAPHSSPLVRMNSPSSGVAQSRESGGSDPRHVPSPLSNTALLASACTSVAASPLAGVVSWAMAGHAARVLRPSLTSLEGTTEQHSGRAQKVSHRASTTAVQGLPSQPASEYVVLGV